MELNDWEEDKLRHLAIRRDVLIAADEGLPLPWMMLDTARSVLAVGTWRWTPAALDDWAALAREDRDGKFGAVLARFEVMLPLLDLAYFDLAVFVSRGVEAAAAEAAGEWLDLVRLGCRQDCTVAVLVDAAGVTQQVAKFAARTRRRLEMVGRLAVLLPGES